MNPVSSISYLLLLVWLSSTPSISTQPDNYGITEHGEPVKILSYDREGKKFLLEEEKFKKVLDQLPPDSKLAVLSIAGVLRSGKSTFLNFILSSLMGKTMESLEDMENFRGFDWKSGHKGCTRGIWVWSQIFSFDRPGSKEKVRLMVIDTEGMDEAKGEYSNDAGIFGLSTVLSSFLIVNVRHQLKNTDLEAMKNFIGMTVKDVNIEGKYFQHLMILVRDSDYTDGYGPPSKEQFEDDFSSLMPKVVQNSFRTISGFKLPPPGGRFAKVADQQLTFQTQDQIDLFMAYNRLIEGTFFSGLKNATEFIKESIQLRTLTENGEPLTAKSLFEFIVGYIQNVDLNDARSHSDYVQEFELGKSVKKYTTIYNETMKKHWEVHKNERKCYEKVTEWHASEKQTVTHTFFIKNDQIYETQATLEYTEKLRQEIEIAFKNTKADYIRHFQIPAIEKYKSDYLFKYISAMRDEKEQLQKMGILKLIRISWGHIEHYHSACREQALSCFKESVKSYCNETVEQIKKQLHQDIEGQFSALKDEIKQMDFTTHTVTSLGEILLLPFAAKTMFSGIVAVIQQGLASLPSLIPAGLQQLASSVAAGLPASPSSALATVSQASIVKLLSALMALLEAYGQNSPIFTFFRSSFLRKAIEFC